ncbi:MAG: aminotransferase class V-fold PLP-dependent enzyme [Ruminococcaceae bacterium]|nr:aminotransferase class V-fold PLP-dependent enzyme [Oscillospiraceae bacterium]
MIYFDNAATTFPKPACVTEEITKCIKKYCGNPGRSSHALSIKSAEKIFEARMLLAELFDGEAENVVFTYNTTYALNIAIKGYLKLSSHILISDIEHNSVLRPINELARQKLCTYDIFNTNGSDEEIIGNIKKMIKPETSMLVCTHASNICSRKLPIEKIGLLCKEHKIFFIVDGAQSAGLYDINVKSMNIDALCLPAHKSLYGPQGIGAIIFGSDKVGKSIIEGGTGINSLELSMPNILPEAYEAGTLSTPSIAGLCGSLKWLKAIEIEKIRNYEEDLYQYLIKNLNENDALEIYKGSDSPGNTLIFNVKGLSSVYVSSELDKRGICTRSGLHCAPLAHRTLKTPIDGAVRIGLSVFNTKNEINILLNALEDIIKEKK